MSRFADIPIPDDVKVTPAWSPLMVELADHIGAYATARLIQAFGGSEYKVPVNGARNTALSIIGKDAAEILSRVFGGEDIYLPLGVQALQEIALRQVQAEIEAGDISITQAARRIGLGRKHLSAMLKRMRQRAEAVADRPAIPLPPEQSTIFDYLRAQPATEPARKRR